MDMIEKKMAWLNKPVSARLRGLFDGKRKPAEVYGLLSEFLSAEGKLLRPALCTASCLAVGGNKNDAVHAASAIEMFHNFTLIHDDIEDCSQLRRGRPCMHIKYGLPLAINAGDGLFMMVWREALAMEGGRREEAQILLLDAFAKVLEGQAVELGWYRGGNWDVGVGEYYKVIEGKTGALISVSCEVGGLLGGGDGAACGALGRFGMGIGVGFQMVDDALNIIGDEKNYGKEIGGDIREGKRTLITIRALKALPGKKAARLREILKREYKREEDILCAVVLMKESGAVESVMETAKERINDAIGELDALPKGEGQRTLRELARYITRRER